MKTVRSNSKKGKYILIGLGVVALIGGTTYMVLQKMRQQKRSTFPDELMTNNSNPIPRLPAVRSTVSDNRSKNQFPIQKGSRGAFVKSIQKALIAKFGKGVLPKFGADGQWGSEMQTAMKRLKLPTSISAELFQKILTSGALQLSGLDGTENQLKTTRETTVWNQDGKKMTLPANTIIGAFVDAENDITQFQTLDNQLLFIKTNTISYV